MTYLYNSRPPLANIIVSMLMVDYSFKSFQLSSLIVNSLQFLSLFWLASEWFKYKGKKIENIHYLLIVLSPFLIWNTIYPWTRGFTNALCFFGFACLLKNNTLSGLMSLSFACVSHYSSLPYFFVAVLFSKSDIKRKLISLSPLILWFAASILVFSASDTFTRSTSFRDLSDLRFSEIFLNSLANTIYSTLPISILSPIVLDGVKEPLYLANVFLSGFYQKTLLGFVGVSLWLPLLHGLRELDRRAKLLIVFSLLFAISLNGRVDFFGLAHITLQPLA